jgi:hypothetical protein
MKWPSSSKKSAEPPTSAPTTDLWTDVVPERLVPMFYSASPLLKLVHSTKPEDIGISGDPPLCRVCTRLFSRYHVLNEVGGSMTTTRFKRVEASAKLGCRICSILYNMEWNPSNVRTAGAQATQKFSDAGPKMGYFTFSVNRIKGRTGECFRLKVVGQQPEKGDLWGVELMLIPEKGEYISSTMC